MSTDPRGPRCDAWSPTPLDPPISAHLPENRADWIVVQVSAKNLKDVGGSEVHKFDHWGNGPFYVRIKPPETR